MSSQSHGNPGSFKRDGGCRFFHPGAARAAGPRLPRLSLHHKQLAACSLMHFVNDGLFYAIFFIIPLAALEFDLSFTQASLIKTFFSLLSSLLQYPCALLVGVISDVGILAWGTAWVGVGMIVMGLSKGIAFLWIATLGAGMGGSAQHPVASSLISRLFPAERRGSAMGTLNFGGDVGKAAFGVLMSVLLLYFTWRQALYGVGAGAALFSLLWYLMVRELAKESKEGRFREVMCSGTKPGVKNGNAGHLLVDASGEPSQRFRRGRFAVLSAIGVVDNATRSTLLTFLPFLYLAKGLGKEHLGIYLTLVATGGLFGKLGCGVLADYLGNVSMIVGTEALTVSLILLCLVTDPGTGLVLAAFLGFFLNGTSSVIYSQAAGIIPVQMRTRGYSIFFTLTLGSSAVVPMLFGMWGDLFQARYGEWIGVVAIFVGMAVMLAMTIPLAAVFYALGRPRPR